MRRSRLAALLLSLVAWWLPAAGAPAGESERATSPRDAIEVVLDFRLTARSSTESVEPTEALLVLTAGPSGAVEARTVSVQIPGRVAIQLPKGSLWRVATRSESYWAAETAVLAVDGESPRVVRLYPAGELTGRLRVAEASAAQPASVPTELAISFQPVHPERRLVPGPGGRETCPVRKDRSWTCRMPAGTYDLRIKGEGFASLFRWEVQVVESAHDPPTDLGTLTLRPGAALFGFVESAGRPLDPETVTVTLEAARPQMSDHLVGRRLDALGESTAVDERGFFHFQDIVPGTYRVSVAAEGFAPLRTPPVDVLPGLETDLTRPLLLQEPARLKVWVDPPTHPSDGFAWSLRLQPRQLDQPAVTMDTDASGAAFLDGLAAGTYELHVGGPDGARWEQRGISLEPGLQTVTIELPLVPVEGTVSQDGEPVRARITFGNRKEAWQIPMVSDLRGRFRGYLPREGTWPISLLFEPDGAQQVLDPVEVERNGSGPAEVWIDVPDTWVAGRVVDANGNPVAHASVLAQRTTEVSANGKQLWTEASETRSDPQGRFHLRGLPEGAYAFDALHGGRSGRATAEVREATPSQEIQITLRSTITISGRIVANSGPVAGAQIFALPTVPRLRRFTVEQAVTDPLGGFKLTVPDDALHATLAVLPFGHVPRLLSWVPGGETSDMEIMVGNVGGSLVLRGQDGRRPALGAFVEHEGLRIPIILLNSWLLLHGGHPSDDAPWILPSMPVGEYRFCGSPQAKSCDGGLLLPNAELALQTEPAEPPDAGAGRDLSAH